MTSNPRIGIIVVAYNAESTLQQTLDRIPLGFAARVSDIVILDDASHDATFELGSKWAKQSGRPPTMVIRHTKNLGYGGNQKAAYAIAAERELDIVVLLHGDGQYAPECLPKLVAPIEAGAADAVFGSRMMTKGAARAGGMPLYKWAGNRILSTLANRMLSTDLSEFHSGYRAYRVSSLNRIPYLENTDDFDFDTQVIIQLLHAGSRICEVPIPTYYGDEICYVNGMKYAKDVVRDLVEYKLAVRGFGTPTWVEFDGEYVHKDQEGTSHAIIQQMLAHRQPLKILDVGCATGMLGAALRERGHYVVGLDLREAPGVRDRVDDFYVADLERGLPLGLPDEFDVVIAADVIEHLPRPVAMLRELRDRLRPGGELILSVPNFGHWYPRARVAVGRFGYDRRGILDDTHLRFFTRRTLKRAVSDGGFDVLEEQVSGLPFEALGEEGRQCVLRRLDRRLVQVRPTLFGYQFVLRLTPHAESQIIA